MQYRVCAVYDTETTNIYDGENGEWRAFPILFICNDLRYIDMRLYAPDACDDIRLYRHECEFHAYIDDLVAWGRAAGVCPIVCAYNLMFDLQPVIAELSARYEIAANAQSSANAYTVDLMEDGAPVLRFWDVFHLEMNGLRAMGDVCGFAKAVGDWDYSKIRTPDTPLTKEEIGYARRDVQVIPAYLRYLLDSNEWMDAGDLGNRVITKTSLVRQTARHRIGGLHYRNARGRRVSLQNAFEWTCAQELPPDFQTYCLRKACFRGGFTFTAARTALQVVSNVASLDVVSMHHQFINGRMVPVHFKKLKPAALQAACECVLRTPLHSVLRNYARPFGCAFHARVRFDNIRLRGCFERAGIGLIPQGKFHMQVTPDPNLSPRNIAADEAARRAGFRDSALNPVFAFGKLYSADACTLHINELELYAMHLVYEWDSMRVILGEGTCKFAAPPDYVTLQSNLFFEMKREMKRIAKNYSQGVPYTCDIGDSIPGGIADGLRAGALSNGFVESYYRSTVKGMFNGIYGTQAQDIYKPSYTCEGGELVIDDATRCTPDTFTNEDKRHVRVLYTYGMRIVGGSRLHLVIALQLLADAFGSRIDLLAGDTDSIKVRCDPDVAAADLLRALQPLHDASQRARDVALKRVRACFPSMCSNLDSVGFFECENEGAFYEFHMEAWNKARISVSGGRVHVTCAGLSRPEGAYTVIDLLQDVHAGGIPWREALPLAFGFNVYADHSISHALQRTQPRARSVYDARVTDYTGRAAHVHAHDSIALYPAGRLLGDVLKSVNARTVEYLRACGRDPMTEYRRLRADAERVYIECEFAGTYAFEKGSFI